MTNLRITWNVSYILWTYTGLAILQDQPHNMNPAFLRINCIYTQMSQSNLWFSPIFHILQQKRIARDH